MSNKLDSATLVVKEVASHAPSLLYVHVADVFDHLWGEYFYAEKHTRIVRGMTMYDTRASPSMRRRDARRARLGARGRGGGAARGPRSRRGARVGRAGDVVQVTTP